jgi:beta-lactamase regulating signal transducer with metallopeptidase domain
MNVFDANLSVWPDDLARVLAAVGELALVLWMQGGILLLAALAWRAATKEPATRVWIARGTLAGLTLLPVLLFVPSWPRWEVRRATATDSKSTPFETSRPDKLLTAEAPPLVEASPPVTTRVDEPILRVDGDSVLPPDGARFEATPDSPLTLAPESTAVEPIPHHVATEAEPVAAVPADTPVLPPSPDRSSIESPLALPTTVSTVRQPPWEWTSLLGAVWLTASACVCVWLTAGWCVVRARVRRSHVAGPALMDELRRVAGRGRLPRLRLAEFWRIPGAVGWWRPVIVLPESVDLETRAKSIPVGDGPETERTLSPQAVRGALAHELAHIRSGDLSLLALERALLPLYFAQPALWLLRRRLRDDQELVADAVAAAGDRVGYAESLLEWVKASGAARRRRDWRMPIFQGVSMSESSGSLARRMEMLLDPNKSIQPRASRRVVWLVLLVVLGATCGLAVIDAASSDGLSRARNWLAARLATDGKVTVVTVPADATLVAASFNEAPAKAQAATPHRNIPFGETVALAEPVFRDAATPQVVATAEPRNDPFASEPTPIGVRSDDLLPPTPGKPSRRWMLRCVIGSIDEAKVAQATETLRTLLPGMESPTAPPKSNPFVTMPLGVDVTDGGPSKHLRETWLPTSEALLRLKLVREAELVKVLGEPTLLTDDHTAGKFHSGGELPVVEVRERINGRAAPANVSFQPFGLSVEVTPKVKVDPLAPPGGEWPMSLDVRISHSVLTRQDPSQPPVIERRTLETTTAAWRKPGHSVILVEQEVASPSTPLSPEPLPPEIADTAPSFPPGSVPTATPATNGSPNPRHERTFALFTIVMADAPDVSAQPLTTLKDAAPETTPPDPIADHPLPMNPGPSVAPAPTPLAPATPPTATTPLPESTPAPPSVVSDPNVSSPPLQQPAPSASKSHTVVKVEFVELHLAKRANDNFVSKANQPRFEVIGAKLEQRLLNPQSGKATHLAAKMHVRELAELRSLLTAPLDPHKPNEEWIRTSHQFRFLADPNRRKLAANDWGVPSASGWSFALEATATAARGRQSDGEEGVTHFDVDARMTSFDIIEEETKFPDLEPMRIVRHRLKQPESARFQVRLAPREVVVFVENLSATRTEAKTAKLEPASLLVAIVSCEAHTELPDWADPNTIRPPSVVPSASPHSSYQWSSAMEGTPVEPLAAEPQALRGKGVNSDAGLTGEVVLPAGGPSSPPASIPSATGHSVLTELEKSSARELEALEALHLKLELLARRGVDNKADLEASSAKCVAARERLRRLRELLETYQSSPPTPPIGNGTPPASSDTPRPLPVPPPSDPNVTTPPTVETPKASPDTVPAPETTADTQTDPTEEK